MKQLKSIKFQLGFGVVALLIALAFGLPMFYAVAYGVLTSFLNTAMDRLFIFLQYQTSASAGQSFMFLVISVIARLAVVISGLYLGFSMVSPNGVISGFVAGHIGYMLDKVNQVK